MMITSASATRVLLDALEEFDAVELGHLQVGHDDVEAAGREFLQGLGAVARRDHLVALGREVLGQRDPLDLLVVGDQDFHGAWTASVSAGLRTTVKTVPCPTTLRTSIRPPISLINMRHSPRPKPGAAAVGRGW